MSTDNPRDVRELSRHRYDLALDRVEAALRADDELAPEALNELRIIRMVGMRQPPWWGMAIDPADTSVTVGVVMRNAFEALGDRVTVNGEGPPPKHWLVQRYVRLWRRGRREYLEWLDTLGLAKPPG